MSKQTITVLHARRDEARKVLTKLSKKAHRYGCPDIKFTAGPPRQVEDYVVDWDGSGRKVTQLVCDFFVEGDAPKVGNYEFVAKLEFTAGGVLVQNAPGKQASERFRNVGSWCDHCETDRQRRDVFVVEDDEGNQMQVGRTCLRDFLGMDSPNAIMGRFRFWQEIDDVERGLGMAYQWSASTVGMLELSAVGIRLFGWCSKGQANMDESLTPTVTYVMLGLTTQTLSRTEANLKRRLIAELSDSDREMAHRVLSWARGLDGSNDYYHNLRVVLTPEAQDDPKRAGLVVSAVAAYQREEERQLRLTKERAEASKSVHLGAEKERLKGLLVTKTDSRVVGGSSFGECVLIKFRTEDGNVLSWFTGSGTGRENGEQFVIDGTVKRHTEFNGVKETQLTRVKVHD